MDYFKYRYLFSGIMFLIASYTDYLDGNIARKNNMITQFGQIMDPLADKMLVCALLIFFVKEGLAPVSAVILIVLREFLLTSIRFLILKGSGKVVSANIFGKLKTISQMIAIIFIFLFQSFLELNLFKDYLEFQSAYLVFYIQDVLVWLSAFFSILSAGVYIYMNRESITSDF